MSMNAKQKKTVVDATNKWVSLGRKLSLIHPNPRVKLTFMAFLEVSIIKYIIPVN
jgi:hypothetical protein